MARGNRSSKGRIPRPIALDALETVPRAAFEGTADAPCVPARIPSSAGVPVVGGTTGHSTCSPPPRLERVPWRDVASTCPRGGRRPSRVRYEMLELWGSLGAVMRFAGLEAVAEVGLRGLRAARGGRLSDVEREQEDPRPQEIAEACAFLCADGLRVPSACADVPVRIRRSTTDAMQPETREPVSLSSDIRN